MTSGNVANIGPNLMVNPNVSASDKDSSTSFMDVMNKNVTNMDKKVENYSSQNNVSDKKTSDTDNSKVDKTTKEDKVYDSKVDKADSRDIKNAKPEDTKVDDSKANAEPVEDTSTVAVEEIPEEVVSMVNEILDNFANEVSKVLEDALDITGDELVNAMESLEVTFADLLNPKQVTELMVEVANVEDSVSLVLNEDLSHALSQVRDLSSQVLEDTGLEASVIKEVSTQTNTFNEVVTNVVNNNMEMTEGIELDESFVKDAGKAVTLEEMAKVSDENALSDEDVTPIIVNKESNVTKDDVSKDAKVSTDNVDEANNPEEAFTRKEVNTNNPNNSDNMARHNDSNNHFVANPTMDSQNIQTEQNIAPETRPIFNRFQTMQLISQISEQARVNITKEVTSLEMILNPESLGKIYLNVSEKQGAMKAQIVAQNEIIKEALENQVAQLKESLNKAGVKVEAVEVSIGTHEFERNLEEGMHGKEEQGRRQEEQASNRAKRTSIDLNNLDDLQGLMSEEDKLVAQIMKDHGNSVNYMA